MADYHESKSSGEKDEQRRRGHRQWTSPRRDGQRQSAEAGIVRRQLFLRSGGHDGAGAVVRQLAGLRAARADGRPGGHRIHAADWPLEGVWRRDRLSGRDVGDGDMGLRAARQDGAADRVRNRARSAFPAVDRRQAVRHRRPDRRGPLWFEPRLWLERRRIRDVRRDVARPRGTLCLWPGMARHRQARLVAEGGFRLCGPLLQSQGCASQTQTL